MTRRGGAKHPVSPSPCRRVCHGNKFWPAGVRRRGAPPVRPGSSSGFHCLAQCSRWRDRKTEATGEMPAPLTGAGPPPPWEPSLPHTISGVKWSLQLPRTWLEALERRRLFLQAFWNNEPFVPSSWLDLATCPQSGLRGSSVNSPDASIIYSPMGREGLEGPVSSQGHLTQQQRLGRGSCGEGSLKGPHPVAPGGRCPVSALGSGVQWAGPGITCWAPDGGSGENRFGSPRSLGLSDGGPVLLALSGAACP